MTALLSDRDNRRILRPTFDPSAEFGLGFPPDPSAGDRWGKFWPAIRIIQNRHCDDDPEAPRLADAVIAGTRRLLRVLEDGGELPPTGMTGSCDATIVLEWHDSNGGQTFRSLDVLSEDKAEEFILNERGQPHLRTIAF